MMLARRGLWVVVSAMAIARWASAGAITDAMRSRIQPDLPASVQALACPETAQETKGLFWCSGALIDGRWIHVQAQRKPDGKVGIIDLVYYPPPNETIRKLALPGVTSEFRTVQCPENAGVEDWNFTCTATLIDGSALTIDAQRRPAGHVGMDRFRWDPSSPSLMIRAVRAAAMRGHRARIATIACPSELRDVFECTAQFEDERTVSFRVQRNTNGSYSVLGTTAKHEKKQRAIGIASIVGGFAILISAIAWLIALNRGSLVTRVPLVAEQTVQLPAAGSHVLHFEKPLFNATTSRMLTIALFEQATGREVPLQLDLFPATTSWSTIRRSIRLFTIPNPGSYLLRVAIPPERDVSGCGLVITRAFFLRGLLSVLLIVGAVLTVMIGFILAA